MKLSRMDALAAIVLVVGGSLTAYLISRGGSGEDPGSRADSATSGTAAEPTVVETVAADSLTILTAEDRARLCPTPDCGEGEASARLPTGSRHAIAGQDTVRGGMYEIIWYRIEYRGEDGWVSEFNTDLAPNSPRRR